jgi:hypothetical protein
MTGIINSATRVKTIIQPHPLGSDGDVQMEASGAGTGLEATPAQDDTAGGSSGDCAIRDVRKNDPCAFPAVPLLFLFCPLWYLTGSLMIPFGVFETSESEIDSPHARTAGCAVSLGATATYRFTSSGQRHAMGVRLGRNSVPPSSFIYRAVLILRRRVRLALLGSHLFWFELSLPVVQQQTCTIGRSSRDVARLSTCQKFDRSKPERANVSVSLSRMPVV